MSEHPKLPDIVERLRAEATTIEHQVRGQDPGDWKEIGLMREAADEIERLRSPAPAEDGDGLREAALERCRQLASSSSGLGLHSSPADFLDQLDAIFGVALNALRYPAALTSSPPGDGKSARNASPRAFHPVFPLRGNHPEQVADVEVEEQVRNEQSE